MISNCIINVMKLENITVDRAFKTVLNWCAYKVGVPGVMFRGNTNTHVFLEGAFDVDVLREQKRDWFGEVYETLGLNKNGKTFKSEEEANQYADSVAKQCGLKDKEEKFPRSIMDADVGTGRTMLILHTLLGEEYVYYGLEEDKLIYRICITNVFLYKVPAKIMCANFEKVKINPSSSNWSLSNEWYPAAQSKLETLIN